MAETEVRKEIETGTMHTHEKERPSLLSNTIAIIGFVIVIVIILWGLFHIATLGSPWLTSLFRGTSPALRLEAPASVTSGTPFAISWKYATSEKGTYAFLYQCKDGVRFEMASANGGMTSIPCGAAFTVAPTNNSLMLVPQLSGTTPSTLSLSLIFIPSVTTSPQAQGNASLTVNPRAGSSTPPPVAPPTPPKPHVSGPADLEVRIISVTPDGAGGGVATFDIGNVGSSASGSYSFSAQLPTTDAQLYQSPAQYSLAPGDHMVNTLRFSQAISGVFSVVVDGTRAEASTANNYASQSVSMPYLPQSYPQPYPYGY